MVKGVSNSITTNNFVQQNEQCGSINEKDVTHIIPSSHGRKKDTGITVTYSITGVLIVIGIVFWAIGAITVNPAFMLVGQVLFGIGITPLVLTVLSQCCCSWRARRSYDGGSHYKPIPVHQQQLFEDVSYQSN